MVDKKKSKGNIRDKVLLILGTVLSLTVLGNFIISAEIFEKSQIASFDREAFATAGGLQTNLNSLIAKSFLPYTDIVNCEPLLDSFVENNKDVLYTFTTDEKGVALYKSKGAVTEGIESEVLAETIYNGEKACIDKTGEGVLYYVLPLQEEQDDTMTDTNVGALVVAYPRSCITEPLRKMYLYNALLAVVTFSVSFFLMYRLLTKRVTKPLQILEEGIRKVSRNGFENSAVEICSEDEIGQIARTFNDMLGQLAVTTVSKDYINSILHNMSEALFVVDMDKRIETVNDAVRGLLGYEPEEIVGKDVTLLLESAADNLFERYGFSAETERNKETEFVTKSGKTIPVSVNWSIIRVEGSENCKYVCTARDITDIKKAQMILVHQANCDELTQLYNRYNLEQTMEQLLKDVRGTHYFAILDLDKFKQVNDICGHAAGDRLLQQVACMLKNAVGESNYVARLGGDEFALILYDTDYATMLGILEGLLKDVQSYRFMWEGKAFSIGMSLGVYEINRGGQDWLAVFHAADTASYISKRNGGNKLHVYTSADDVLCDEDEQAMVAEINEAFDTGRFFLAYSRITPTDATSAKKMYEVSMRMQRKDGTILEQGVILPVMERYQKLAQLEQRAIHYFSKCYHQEIKNVYGTDSVQFIINLSEEALCAKHLGAFIRQEFNKYDIPPQAVCFQMKESSMISYFAEVSTLMKSLYELGCRISINDFGMGMASFMYLRMLPVSYIKLSSAFVNALGKSVVDTSIVKSINDIAHLLNIETIAECVDSNEVLGMLQELGVDYIQDGL